MLASYLLSRTLVPTMVHYLLRERGRPLRGRAGTARAPASSGRIHGAFNRRFERLREWLPARCSTGRSPTARRCWSVFAVFVLLSLGARLRSSARTSSRRWTPGQFRLHVRAPAGHAHRGDRADLRPGRGGDPRGHPRRRDLDASSTTSGIPIGGINLAFGDSATIGAADGEILISLKPRPPRLDRRLHEASCAAGLPAQFPELTFFFQPADIVSQILNFGLPAPIDVQVVGSNRAGQLRDRPPARRPRQARSRARSTCTCTRWWTRPQLRVDVDRTRRGQIGLTQRDVANSLLISLSSSSDRWRRTSGSNPQNGVELPRRGADPAVPHRQPRRAHQRRRWSPAGRAGAPQLLANLADGRARHHACRSSTTTTSQPVFDVFANVQDRDLGSVGARRATGSWPRSSQDLPRGHHARRCAARCRPCDSVVPRPGRRHGLRRGAGLPADGGELPVLARPVHHPHGAARRARRHRAGCSSSPRPRSACPP